MKTRIRKLESCRTFADLNFDPSYSHKWISHSERVSFSMIQRMPSKRLPQRLPQRLPKRDFHRDCHRETFKKTANDQPPLLTFPFDCLFIALSCYPRTLSGRSIASFSLALSPIKFFSARLSGGIHQNDQIQNPEQFSVVAIVFRHQFRSLFFEILFIFLLLFRSLTLISNTCLSTPLTDTNPSGDHKQDRQERYSSL